MRIPRPSSVPGKLQSMAMSSQQLPALPETQRLSPRVVRILGSNPGKFTLQGTNTYLVGAGPSRILIDTGEGRPQWLAALKAALAREQCSISAAIITHWHHDHVGGIAQLLELAPATPVYKNRPQGAGQRDIADGQTFEADGVRLTAVHTPGHTQDHVVLHLAEEDALFTGDNVLGHGTAVFEDLATYMASLRRMHGLFSGRAYPGHGELIEDGPAKVDEYMRHRQLREEQVVQVLRSDSREEGWTPMELVKVIYRDVPENLHPAAAAGVYQILKKLEGEGKVVDVGEDGLRWRLAVERASAL